MRSKIAAVTLLGLSLIATHLSAASVSVVNSTPSATTSGTTSGSAVTPAPANPYNPNTKSPTGPVTGKLPAGSSKSGGVAARKPKLEAQLPVQHTEQPTYTYPGLLAKIGKRWIGSDYLYNMHKNIGVKVEVVKQEGKDVSIDEEGLSQIVSDIFLKSEIVPESLASDESPPLPFFHVLIFAFPSETSNVAFVSGRLFEDALLARYGLDPIGVWQAISWEKQDLVITSPLQFDEQLKKSVANIAQTFVDRVEMYSKIKAESESNAKLYYPSVVPTPRKDPAVIEPVKPTSAQRSTLYPRDKR